MTDLSGKSALVTGASRGIGCASAFALAKAGGEVMVHYSRGTQEAGAVVTDMRHPGGRADTILVDLAAAAGAHTFAKQVGSLVGDRHIEIDGRKQETIHFLGK